jgi:hypothetical protein
MWYLRIHILAISLLILNNDRPHATGLVDYHRWYFRNGQPTVQIWNLACMMQTFQITDRYYCVIKAMRNSWVLILFLSQHWYSTKSLECLVLVSYTLYILRYIGCSFKLLRRVDCRSFLLIYSSKRIIELAMVFAAALLCEQYDSQQFTTFKPKCQQCDI